MQMLKEMARLHKTKVEDFIEELISYNYSTNKKNVFHRR